ncbi:MAG: hypothetical protein M3Q17_06950 [Actinomycetota bacterium]|nr:hypothetical protein [Actinomycetota bacterium]
MTNERPATRQRWAESLRERADQITARVTTLVEQVQAAPPGWARGLHPVPTDPAQLQQWRNAVGLVAAYREQYGITTGPTRLLGTAPDEGGVQARAHAVASDALAILVEQHHARPRVGHDSPLDAPPAPAEGASHGQSR